MGQKYVSLMDSICYFNLIIYQQRGQLASTEIMVVRAFSGHKKDAMRKELEKLFKYNDFRITVEIDFKCVDFLDVQFDLSENKYIPYRKPNDTPMYINEDSNHPPPNVIKQILKMASIRLNQFSCNEAEFKKAVVYYPQVLHSSLASLLDGCSTKRLSLQNAIFKFHKLLVRFECRFLDMLLGLAS